MKNLHHLRDDAKIVLENISNLRRKISKGAKESKSIYNNALKESEKFFGRVSKTDVGQSKIQSQNSESLMDLTELLDDSFEKIISGLDDIGIDTVSENEKTRDLVNKAMGLLNKQNHTSANQGKVIKDMTQTIADQAKKLKINQGITFGSLGLSGLLNKDKIVDLFGGGE